MKHTLIILISILLFSSPVIGQSSKYESVNQCVLQTMEDRKLTGNKMFEMVKEECERSLGKGKEKEKDKKGVLYLGIRNGKGGYYTEEWEGVESEDNKDIVKYEGYIVNGFPNGQGTTTYPDGSKYIGEWKNGKYNGQGTYTFPNGGKYEGEYKNGKYNGQGTYTYPNGGKYEGEYKNDKRNGQGTYTWSDGGKYVGEFKDNQKNGQGTMTLPSGSKFVGEFKDDKTWNGIGYDKYGNITLKKVNGRSRKQ